MTRMSRMEEFGFLLPAFQLAKAIATRNAIQTASRPMLASRNHLFGRGGRGCRGPGAA